MAKPIRRPSTLRIVFLKFGVGGAFAVGFILAIGIYGRGLALADRIKRIAGPLHTLLEKKYYFDEVYDLVWVKGCLVLAHISRFIDTYIVDLIINTLAALTERLAAFSGMVLDKHGVDGVFNGIAVTSLDLANGVRKPQTGRIRHYVLFAAGVATIIIICVLIYVPQAANSSLAAAGSAIP